MNDTIMHVVEPDGAGCGPCTLSLVGARAEAEDARIVVLGSRRTAQQAIDAGCRVDASIPVPLGIPRLAGSGLRAAWERGRETRVIAWSEGAAAAAALLPGSVRVEATISAAFGRVPWLEPWRRGRVEVTGVGPEVGRVLGSRCWRVGPGINVEACGFPAVREQSNRALIRSEWGADEDELVIACVSDPPAALDLFPVFNSAILAIVCGRRVRLIAHPESRGAQHVARFARSFAKDREWKTIPLRFDERLSAPWMVADGVDCMLQILRSGRESIESASLLPLPWWLAAGVPTVVSHQHGAGGVIQNDVDGEILLRSGRDEIAAAIMRFCDDRKRLSKMAQAAEDRWQPAKRVAGNAGATSVQ